MKMAPSLKRILLGSDRIAKLFHPWIVLHLFYHGVWPLTITHLYSVHPPGSLLLRVFQKRDRTILDPSSQGRLRLLSGTPQGTMEPLKVATGFGMHEKAPTTEKHFVVILGGATQFHLGNEPTSALEFSAFHSGMDLRMRVFFQFLHHHLSRVFKQIDGTPFLGTLEPQGTKIGLGVDAFQESMGMKRACLVSWVTFATDEQAYSQSGERHIEWMGYRHRHWLL